MTSDPAAISCTSTCQTNIDHGAVLELTATPDPGSQFIGWFGDCTGTGTCMVTMDAMRGITARFEVDGYLFSDSFETLD